MGLTLITAPASFAVALAEAKAFCRIETDEEDALVQTLIEAASGFIADYTGRAIGAQVWELALDRFEDSLLLPNSPVTEVVSVKYSDPDGNEQTADPALYSADLSSDPAWLVRNASEVWPVTLAGVNAVRVRFGCGFDPVPASIRQAALLLIGHWYANREAVNVGNIVSMLPFGVEWLLANHRSFA